jgi:hypothetical protein
MPMSNACPKVGDWYQFDICVLVANVIQDDDLYSGVSHPAGASL